MTKFVVLCFMANASQASVIITDMHDMVLDVKNHCSILIVKALAVQNEHFISKLTNRIIGNGITNSISNCFANIYIAFITNYSMHCIQDPPNNFFWQML